MNKIIFKVKNCKVPSANAARATNWKTKRQFKTKDYEQFEQRVKIMSLGKRKDIDKFEHTFNIYESHISMTPVFWIPYDRMYTKKGYISHRSGDSDNYLKCSIDAVFKTFNKLDDKYIKHYEEVLYLESPDDSYHFAMQFKERSNEFLQSDHYNNWIK